jgi:hypothetical protein
MLAKEIIATGAEIRFRLASEEYNTMSASTAHRERVVQKRKWEVRFELRRWIYGYQRRQSYSMSVQSGAFDFVVSEINSNPRVST